MSQSISFNGVVYTIPDVGDDGWGQNLTDYFTAIPGGALQKIGGSFSLTADVNFGATFGLVSAYFKSRSSNIATSGILRLANLDAISWRNSANNANLPLSVDSSNNLTYNGVPITSSSGVVPVAAGGTGLTSGTSGGILGFTASGVIASSALLAANQVLIGGGAGATPTSLAAGSQYQVLVMGASDPGYGSVNLAQSAAVTGLLPNTKGGTGGDSSAQSGIPHVSAGTWSYSEIVNNDVSASAAIAYSKLNLSSSIVNADISGSAAIAYSKLNLATSIVNADVSASAAIAYSKLNLATSIVNADVSASAAIALSKLAATTASRALVSDASGFVSAATTTATEIGYVNGVTSAIQTQFSGKLPTTITTTGDLIYSSSGTTASRLAIGSSGQVLTVSGGLPTWQNTGAATAPKITRYTSGSGTFTVTGSPLYLRVVVVGSGGGGGGSGTTGGAGTAGNTSSFGTSLLTATGGGAGGTNQGGTAGSGGTVTINSPAVDYRSSAGGAGQPGFLNTNATVTPSGGTGGCNQMGGSGKGGSGGVQGGVAATNTGAGGGGGSGATSIASGHGGGAGGYIEAVISSSISSTYSYVVGAAGGAGAAGSGSGAVQGGDGAAGVVIVMEYYQ